MAITERIGYALFFMVAVVCLAGVGRAVFYFAAG